VSIEDTARKLASLDLKGTAHLEATARAIRDHLKAQEAEDAEVSRYLEAARRQRIELTEAEVRDYLARTRREAMREAARRRRDIVEEALARVNLQPERAEPEWRRWREWQRSDFEKAVRWDQEHGGRGGRRAIAARCLTSPSPLYRRWQALAGSSQPWPSGNKGPQDRA
jgi:hypothetical protein